MDTLTRVNFLNLSWDQQKATDFRKVFDPETDTDLTANCISHQDDTASMVVYANAVYCFGCRKRWWPDQFLWDLGIRDLVTERGARKQDAPKFIPFGQVDTYRTWLWGNSNDKGYYAARQSGMLDRGLTRETCVSNFIGHTGEAYSIPIFGPGGGVVSVRYRRDDELASEDRPKYWGTAGANQSMLYVPRGLITRNSYGVILCEGELDALRLLQEGYPAFSLTNGCGALNESHIPLLDKHVTAHRTRRITVCYDQDQPGMSASDAAVRLLGHHGFIARRVLWHSRYGKDATELYRNGQTLSGPILDNAWH